MLELENEGQDHIHNTAIRWLISTSVIVIRCILLRYLFTISKILMFQIVLPWKFRSRSQSTTFTVTKFKICKCHVSNFSRTVSDIFTFQNLWPWKCRRRSWCTPFAVAPFDGKYTTCYLMAIVVFALSFAICEIFT